MNQPLGPENSGLEEILEATRDSVAGLAQESENLLRNTAEHGFNRIKHKNVSGVENDISDFTTRSIFQPDEVFEADAQSLQYDKLLPTDKVRVTDLGTVLSFHHPSGDTKERGLFVTFDHRSELRQIILGHHQRPVTIAVKERSYVFENLTSFATDDDGKLAYGKYRSDYEEGPIVRGYKNKKEFLTDRSNIWRNRLEAAILVGKVISSVYGIEIERYPAKLERISRAWRQVHPLGEKASDTAVSLFLSNFTIE